MWRIVLSWGLPLAAFAAPAVPYQGRLLTVTGEPVQGAHDVAVALYPAATGGSALFVDTFDDVDFQSGYFLVVLEQGLGGVTINPQWLAAPMWVGVSLDGATELSPRQPLQDVPRAVISSHIPLSSAGASGACADPGAIVWDTTSVGLLVCDGTVWRRVNAAPPPSLSSIAPTSAAFGTQITVNGTNFLATDGLTVGSATCAVTYVSPTQLRCDLSSYVPPSVAHDVRVVRDAAIAAALGGAFTRTPSSLAFTTVGAGSWTAPAGVVSVTWQLWGGGGGGGGITGLHTGSGGGGGYSTGTTPVTPGTPYAYTVGLGGPHGTCNVAMAGTSGGTTTFVGHNAGGGGGGSPHGNGGSAGSGETANGTAGNGSDANGGAAGGPGGGAGGAVGTDGGCNHGQGNGSAPGGGGGGRYGGSSHGGDGARGEIRISF